MSHFVPKWSILLYLLLLAKFEHAKWDLSAQICFGLATATSGKFPDISHRL